MSTASRGRTAASIVPDRVVCLVPSTTEALVELGLGSRLVGRTRYCVEPAGRIEAVEAVGGTKNPDVARIVALAPDLVVVSSEENRLVDAQALVEAGVAIYVTHPRTVAEAVAMFEDLGHKLGLEREVADFARQCRDALARAAAAVAGIEAIPTFCPIWRNPWMTFGRQTYVGDVLSLVGQRNVLATDGSPDFFEVTLDQVVAARPQLVVLPDEPYVFSRKHGEELRTHGIIGKIHYIDGKDLSWYGPRIPRALDRLLTITRDLLHG